MTSHTKLLSFFDDTGRRSFYNNLKLKREVRGRQNGLLQRHLSASFHCVSAVLVLLVSDFYGSSFTGWEHGEQVKQANTVS